MKTGIAIAIVIIGAIIIGITLNKNQGNFSKNPASPTNSASQELLENQKALSPADSTFTWVGKKTFITDWVDTGSVGLREGSITLNQGMVTGGRAVIDMSSITAEKTGSGSNQDKLSTHLKSADFFDVEMYPTAEITINSIQGETASADLTIKGITKPIEFPITITQEGDRYIISGTLAINRTEFDVKFGSKVFFGDLIDRSIIDDTFMIAFRVVSQ